MGLSFNLNSGRNRREISSKTTVSNKYVINGKEYTSFDDIPEEFKAMLDKDGDGVSDNMQRMQESMDAFRKQQLDKMAADNYSYGSEDGNFYFSMRKLRIFEICFLSLFAFIFIYTILRENYSFDILLYVKSLFS